MSQSKKGSLLESVVNVMAGYCVSFIANMTILPMFGLDVSVSDGLWIGLAYSAISLIRSYTIRRIFNHRLDTDQSSIQA